MPEIQVNPPVVKVNSVLTFLGKVWAVLEQVDTVINKHLTALVNGYSVVVILIVAAAYMLIEPLVGVLLTIPAMVIKWVLDALAITIPAVISAVPFILEIALGLLVLVELVNLVKRILKR
jgi:hypothetical protein